MYKCIYNGTILTMNQNKDIILNGAIVYLDDKIIEIGLNNIIDKYNITEKIDADNGIVMPGFINCHNHVSMSVFRSLGDDIKDRLNTYMLPLEDELVDENLVYIGAKLGIFEMIMGGVTTFADMYYFEDEVAKAAFEIGIRCVAGETVIDKPSPDSKENNGGLDYSLDFIQKWKNNDLIIPAIAPHSTYFVPQDVLIKIKELALKHDVPILIHASETLAEMDYFKTKFNCTPIEYLNNIGFLCEKVVFAHLVYVTDSDIDLILKNKCSAVHCVAGNAKSGRTVSPAPKMYSKGVKIGFGTDGPMSGNHLDIISLLGYYTKIHKLFNLDVTMCKTIEAVSIGTIGGAKALGIDKIVGSLEVGKKADIIVIETKSPNIIPIYDYYSVLTYSANPSNVVTSVINGKLVMHDRKLLYANYTQTINEFLDITKKIQHKAKELESIARKI